MVTDSCGPFGLVEVLCLHQASSVVLVRKTGKVLLEMCMYFLYIYIFFYLEGSNPNPFNFRGFRKE